jgi:subfamily B ATP-binding cassette protein HlyB/CyaB
VESLAAIPAVKAAAAEEAQLARWQGLCRRAARAGTAALAWSNTLTQGSALVQKMGTAATLWLGARLVGAGELSVGELVAFNLIAARLVQPALRLAQGWQEWQQAVVAIQRLDSVMRTLPEASAQHVVPATPRGEIRFEDVGFRYRPQGPEVLRGLSFHLPAGSVVGIVGASGCGKSTLAKLLQRLYVPHQGRILLDGTPIGLHEPRSLRRQFGVVAQDARIFNRSVRENIALRDPDTPLEQVVRAAALAGAEGFILDLPEGYDTVLGENGVSLSGGQRQRLALARALLGAPRVLILDEATAALDYQTEALFMQQLPRIAAGRTVMLIAHRLTPVRLADRILVLKAHRGEVQEFIEVPVPRPRSPAQFGSEEFRAVRDRLDALIHPPEAPEALA